MRVLVCGGRDYNDYTNVKTNLDQLHASTPITLVIHGGANGADTLAGIWCRERGIPYAAVPALWDFYGKAAGPRRNAVMLTLDPDLVAAFPGGRGTANMVEQAKGRQIEVVEIPSAPDFPPES